MVATSLRRGQLAIVQLDSEDSDDPHVAGTQNMARDTVSFVLLAPVGSGTVIHFTDRTWTPSGSALNGGAFAASGSDGTLTWTAAVDLPAGTVITLTNAELAAAGIQLADGGEVIWAYQGSNANTPTAFLFAVEYGDGNDTFEANLGNTGLAVGNGAVAVAEDNISYGERIHNQNAPVLFQNLSDHTNWHSNENSPQNDHVEGTNLIVAPDIQLWIAGISGGHGLISVSGDATQNGGAGYNVQTHFQNTNTDLNGVTATQRFHSPTHILFDTVAGKFFVVDSTGGIDRILQGNISDLLTNPGVAPTMTILWSDKPAVQDGDGITSIQIDKASGHIYFTADNTLLRVNVDTADQTAVVLANLGNDPDSGSKNFANELALDLANGRAFVISTETFSNYIAVPPGTPGAIPDGDGWVVFAQTVSQNSLHMVSGISPGDTNATGNTIVQLEINEAFNEDNGFYGDQTDEFDDAFGRITVQVNSQTGEIWFTTVQIETVAGSVGGIYKATLSGNALTVTQIYAETSGTNQNFFHINIDEETGFYYVTSVENGQSGNHAVYRGALSAAPGTAPTFFATVGNINEMAPRDLTIESAPTLAGNAAGGLAVTEASSAPLSAETTRVFLYQSLVADDLDTLGGDELAGAQVRISAGLVFESFPTAAGHSASADSLTINGTNSGTIAGSGIAYSYNQSTGIMTLTGAATTAEYAAALQLVQFSTRGDNVTDNGGSTSRTVSVSVFDGLLYSDEIHATVAVTGINDAPVNSVGTPASFTEDTTGSAGAVPVNAITGLTIADADADQTTDLFTVTLSVANGTLTIRTDVAGGLTAGNVTGNGTGTIVLTGTETQINATLLAVNGSSLANGLIYTPNAHFNGADTLTMVTNDQGNSGNDPGLTGTGTSEQDSDTKTLNVAEVNDAPTVVDATQDAPAILEDVPFTNLDAPTVADLLGASFSDALDVQQTGSNPTGSPGDTLAGIAIVSATANANGAWQYWDGDSWENIGAGTQAAARTLTAGTQLRFNPTLDYNGPAPTLTVHLIESGGSAITNNAVVNLSAGGATGGATVYSAGTVVLGQSVTSVNDAPTATNIAGESVTYTEGQALAALLDGGSNATLADVDSANFDGGTLTVAITGGLVVAEDQLVIRLTGTVSFNATAAFVNGTQIATYSGAGAGGGPLVFTFDGDATPAAVAQLIRAVAYTNGGGDNPTDGDRTITWTLVDGDGTANTGVDTVQFATTVDVDPVNDAPAGADRFFTFDEEGSRTLSQADFGFSDAENHGLAGVAITTLPTNGTLLLNGVAITVAGTFVTAAQIAANGLVFESDTDENGTPYASFTFQVRDAGGTADGGQDTDQSANTMTFDVDPINDAPVNTLGATVIIDEDAVGAPLTGMSIFDVDAGNDPITILLEVGHGVLAISETVVGGITSDEISGNGSSSVTIIATLAQINATLAAASGVLYTPVADFSGNDTLTVTTNDGGASGADGPLEDVDTRTITVNSINDAPAGSDGTIILNEDGSRALTQADFGFGDAAEGNGFAGTAITTLPTNGTLLLNGVAIAVAGTFVTAAQLAAGELVFAPDADDSGASYASFTFQVRDDGGTASGGQDTDQSANTITFDVTAVNDAPVVTVGVLPGATEQLAVDLKSAIAIADVDAGAGALTMTLSVDYGAIAVGAGTSGAMIVSGDGADTVIVSGTLAQLNALLSTDGTSTVVYTPDSDTPPASATLTVAVDDGGNTGADGAKTGSATGPIAIAAVDDPAIANADTATSDENATVAIAVLANDTEPDGPAPSVIEIDGQAVSVGGSVTLASGATATLNANGTIGYDPNGKFNQLISPAKAAATGASNSSATDGFTYTLLGGATAAVAVTVNGVDSADDRLQGTTGNDTITGTPLGDIFMLQDDGEDAVTGLDGDDGFYMGTALCAGDVLDGGAGIDQVGLQGSYGAAGLPWIFEPGNFAHIEMLVLLPGDDARFGNGSGLSYSYFLETVDENVAAGERLQVSFNTLRVGEDVSFDGSAETDGYFLTYGGLGNDTVIGGQQDDGFFFGFGRWGAGDSVDGQGGAMDQLGLQGVYSGASAIAFGAGQIANIEMIVLLTGGDTRFGSGGAPYSYDLTMNEGNVAGGESMWISATTLAADETLSFNGAAETDGRFVVYGGAGQDSLTGGAGDDEMTGAGGSDTIAGGLGADTLRGGAGDDIFAYLSPGDSTAASMDRILDFASGDRIDLGAIDADGDSLNGDTGFSYIGNAAFTNIAGQLRAFLDGGVWKVEGDIDGDGIADLVIEVTTTGGHELVPADFWL
jgi:large repetitive protein